ncbi:hypothetical protein F4815DRAFT_467520 [Daldinia loculata]|nr:hypothetical protein F4815DRAFT_467520 [Daldinia loculata]
MGRGKKGHGARKKVTKGVTNNEPYLDPAPFTDFCTHIDKKKRRFVGLDAFDNDTSFIPFEVLRDYWTKARVNTVLKAFRGSLTFNIENIRNHYIRIFSILVYCDAVSHLQEFTRHNLNDAKLPLKQYPAEWPTGPIYARLFGKFSKH